MVVDAVLPFGSSNRHPHGFFSVGEPLLISVAADAAERAGI
jgi:hypothetical protein